MIFQPIPGLVFNGQAVGIQVADSGVVVVTTPPVVVPTVPDFMAPQSMASRTKMVTHALWVKGTPSFYSSAPLTDSNCWLICFTPTDKTTASIATAEYQGENTPRNWELIRNRDGAVIATSGSRPVQGPAITLNGVSNLFTHAVSVDVGERYTFGIANAVVGVSSRMVGQLYM